MFLNDQIYKLIKVFSFLLIIIAKKDIFVEVALLDDIWKTNANLFTEPIYDGIILLAQSKQQQQQQLQQQLQQQQQQHQNTNAKDKIHLYPVPAKIFYKNRFKYFRDIRSLFYNKKTTQYMVRNNFNQTNDGSMTDLLDVHARMNVNNNDDIHAIIINKIPVSIVSNDQQYYYDGYSGSGYITMNVSDNNNSSELTNIKSTQTSKRLRKFSNSETYKLMNEIRERFFRSNTEIFNQILSVRKVINSIRKDIRKVQQFMENLKFNITASTTTITNTAQRFYKRMFTGKNSKGGNLRLRQIKKNFSPQYNREITKKPINATFPWPTNISNNRSLIWYLHDNVASTAVNDLINVTKLPIEKPIHWNQRKFVTDEEVIESVQKGQLLSLINNESYKNQSLFVAKKTNDTVKIDTTLSISRECNQIGKTKNETFWSKKQKVLQNESKKLANIQLLVTIQSPKNEQNEIQNIAVTEAYQSFSIKRFIAHSMIHSDKSISKLINLHSTKSLATIHELLNPVSVTKISGHGLPHVTVLPLQLSSTENPSTLEFGNNSRFVILNSSSSTISKTSNQVTATPIAPILFLTSTISNSIIKISTSTTSIVVSTIGASTTSTTATITTASTGFTTISKFTSIATKITPAVSRAVQPSTTFEKIRRRNLKTMPPLIPLKPNFFGNYFDGIFVPWFNDHQMTVWPNNLLQRG